MATQKVSTKEQTTTFCVARPDVGYSIHIHCKDREKKNVLTFSSGHVKTLHRLKCSEKFTTFETSLLYCAACTVLIACEGTFFV
jgi:hypothetical protein